MKKRVKIHIICVLCTLLIIVITIICYCSFRFVKWKYDKNWIIGKTSSEIEVRYGKFDIISSLAPLNDKGNYYSACGGYLTKTGKWSSAFGLDLPPTDEFFMIYFDETGTAYKFKENVPRKGG